MTGNPGKKRHGCALLCAWAALSTIAGIATTNIPWGKPEGVHGVGLPVAGVIWDKLPGGDRFVDFPNPLAYVINPVVFFVAGLLLYASFRFLRALGRSLGNRK